MTLSGLRSCSSVTRRRLPRLDLRLLRQRRPPGGPAADPDRRPCRARSAARCPPSAAARRRRGRPACCSRRAPGPAPSRSTGPRRSRRRSGSRRRRSSRASRCPARSAACGCCTDRPGVRPKVTASTDVSSATISTPPLRTKLLEVDEPAPAEARPHVVGRVDLADVRRQRRRLPRQRVAPHRHARRRSAARRGPTGGNTRTSHFAFRFASFATTCVLM